MSNIISCGNVFTAKAAAEVMKKQGNAFDGIVAACFASFVTEPMLTTAAGGGVGLLRFPNNKTKCIDFLGAFPSKARDVKAIKKIVSFGDEVQTFYMGYGSLAIPGTLQGLLHIYNNYCSLELKDLVAPAIRYSKGHRLDKFQAYVCEILNAFCFYTKQSREIFVSNGELLKQGDIIRNKKFADFLTLLAKDQESALDHYYNEIEKTVKGKKSALTTEDVLSYKVIERNPVSIKYQGHSLSLAPPPSAGGLLVAHGLKYIEDKLVGKLEHNSVEHADIVVDAMKECDSRRTKTFFKNLLACNPDFCKTFLKRPDRLGGTTHISIVDDQGNAAGITNSNGQGSGVMAGNTGIMLNNFAAEPDLMQYKDLYKIRGRITTMMAPTIITKNNKLEAVLGSGGSNRIRSAIFQTISNLLDFNMLPEKATNASRFHYENDLLQIEYGVKKQVAKQLSKKYKTNIWTVKNLFFGGVHIATPNAAAGDKRRAGTTIVE